MNALDAWMVALLSNARETFLVHGTFLSTTSIVTCSRVSIFSQSLEAVPIETLATRYFLPLFRLLILWIMSPDSEIVPCYKPCHSISTNELCTTQHH